MASTDPSSGADSKRDQGEYTPTDQAPDPVLQEAFGRPYGGRRLTAAPSRRHRRAGGRARRDKPEQPDDPWRDPGAAAALGTPAVPTPAPAPAAANVGKARRARRALRRPGVLCGAGRAGDHRAGDRFRRRLGGPQDRRGRRGVHHVEGDAVHRRQLRTAGGPLRESCGIRCGFSRHHRSGRRQRRRAGIRRRRRRPRLHRHQQPRDLRGRHQPQPVQAVGGVQRRQGGAGQPRRPRPEDRPGRAEGRQRRQPHRGEAG